MKKALFFILLWTINGITFSQVPSTFFADRNAFDAYPALKQTHLKSKSTAKKMPAIENIQQLLAEDNELASYGDFPFRFGYGFDVDDALS